MKVTKEVFEFARENGFVRFKEGARKRDIQLDTSHWEEKEDVAMTHSLLF